MHLRLGVLRMKLVTVLSKPEPHLRAPVSSDGAPTPSSWETFRFCLTPLSLAFSSQISPGLNVLAPNDVEPGPPTANAAARP